MKKTFLNIKKLFAGKWIGEGFSKYPTINDTFYTEHLEYIPDEYKDSIFYNQKHGIKMIQKTDILYLGMQDLLF